MQNATLLINSKKMRQHGAVLGIGGDVRNCAIVFFPSIEMKMNSAKTKRSFAFELILIGKGFENLTAD